MAGYDFFIERPERPLERDEWDRFVAGHASLTPSDDQARRDTVVWPRGDDEDPEEANLSWIPGGSILVKIDVYSGDEIDDLVDLAASLGAQVRGESGEIYRGGGVVDG
jgi:hypothetical protein